MSADEYKKMYELARNLADQEVILKYGTACQDSASPSRSQRVERYTLERREIHLERMMLLAEAADRGNYLERLLTSLANLQKELHDREE